ncbi:MAG: arsenate reductase ArsC [Candidatus Zixiibacteriota bacterium]|nr:MAG: arsenate reductase ArsC [candidate division Zixibacteria bacterium]
MKKILFICTGNSARSVMAEVLMNELGEGRYRAFSAGAKPSGEVNPLTIEILKAHNHSTGSLRSKPLSEFLDKDLDVVVTVCDKARQSCPAWPRKTLVLHWGFDDPAEFEGNPKERLAFFEKIYGQIRERIERFLEEKMPSGAET